MLITKNLNIVIMNIKTYQKLKHEKGKISQILKLNSSYVNFIVKGKPSTS